MLDEVHDVAVADINMDDDVLDLRLFRVGRDLHVLDHDPHRDRVLSPIRPLDFDDLLDVDTLLGDEGI